MKIYKEYKIMKDLPELPIGTILHWDLWQERYTELLYIGMNDIPKANYKKEFLDSHSDWFKPIGEPEELLQKFPADFEEINDSGHFYFGELRHNKMCRFCWDARSILESKEFRKEVTKIFKNLYDKKISLALSDNK